MIFFWKNVYCINRTYIMGYRKSPDITASKVKNIVHMTPLMSLHDTASSEMKIFWKKSIPASFASNATPKWRYFLIRANLKVVFDYNVS